MASMKWVALLLAALVCSSSPATASFRFLAANKSPTVPKSPPPAPPPAPCLATCPRTPTEKCDFYFKGNLTAIPTFKLWPNASFDGTVGTPVANDKASANFSVTQVSNFGAGCPNNTVAGVAPGTGLQFQGDGASLRIKTTQSMVQSKAFVNSCVVLPITNMKLVSLVSGKNNSLPLNAGDRNSTFVESRRCVVFYLTY